MQRLASLRAACDDSADFVTWLKRDAASAVPANKQDQVEELIVHVSSKFPDVIVQGFANDYRYTMLYRLAPPRWLCDGVIYAFCGSLVARHPTARFAGIVSASLRLSRVVDPVMDLAAVAGVASMVREAGVSVMLIPVNFGNQHWCTLAVLCNQKQVVYYGSMNGAAYARVLDVMAWEVARSIAGDNHVVAINSPLEFDGFSCGVYVCLTLWGYTDSSVAKEVPVLPLAVVRYRIAQHILRGATADANKENDAGGAASR